MEPLFEPCIVKMGLYASAESINTSQPTHLGLAEQGQNFSRGQMSSSEPRFKLYIVLHALPLGKVTSNSSFHMNIHVVGKYPNSESKDC